MRRLTAAGGLLVLLVAACGSQGEPGPAQTSVAPETSSPAPAPSAIAMDDRQRAKIAVAGNPDWLAADGRSLYVKTDSGTVVVVNPSTNQIVRTLGLGAGGLCQGLGFGFGSVWTCSPDATGASDDVLRLDPRSGKVLAKLPVGKKPDQGHLEATSGRMWVLSASGLVGIDPATNRPDPPIDLGVAGTDLAVDGKSIWVVSVADGAAVQVDVATRQVVARAEGLDSPRTLTIGEKEVWVLTRGGLVALDRDGLGQLGTVPVGAQACGLAATPDAVWVSDTGPFLHEVDAAARRVRTTITAETPSCGDVRVAMGSVWASAADDDVVYRLDP